MVGIQATGIACVGRILKTGIWILQHLLIGQRPGINSAHPGQAACPCGASTLPLLGKQRAHLTPESVIRCKYALYLFHQRVIPYL